MTEKRQTRLPREQLRALMLQTGRDLLTEEGLGTGVDTLSFKRIFGRILDDTGVRLSNASVIRRVWENQADYQADVLALVAADDGLGEYERTFEALAPLFDAIDLTTPASRDRSLVEVCRVGGAANIFALLESPNWSLWIAVWALATADNPGADDAQARYQERIREALVTGYDKVTELWEDAYRALAALLGLRVREPLTIRQFTVAIGALAEGCALRQRVDGQMEGILRPTGPNGEDQEWTLFGMGLEALQRLFFEPDPDWSPPPESAGLGGPSGS